MFQDWGSLLVLGRESDPALEPEHPEAGAAQSVRRALGMDDAAPGQILGTIENGRRVLIIDRTLDAYGKPWIYIAGAEDEKPIGWVIKQYVDCF